TSATAPPPLAGVKPAPQGPAPPPISSGLGICGAGFIPADGGEIHTSATAPPPLAGVKPAPQGAAPAPISRRPRNLWGRVYPGLRRRDPHFGNGPTPAGRREGRPHRVLRQRQSRAASESVGPGLSRPTAPRSTLWQRPHPRWPA